MTGRSLLPVLRGEAESAYAPGDIRAIEVSGNSALYRDGYKIVRSVAPVGDGQWRLYDLSTDPGEVIDLSEAQPARLESMLEDYADYAARVGVQPMPEGYSSTAQIQRNTLKRLRSRNMPRILAVLFLLLIGVVVLARVPRKGQA
jgi:arylsulfatase/uncharacterized sulfatase